MFLFFIFYLFIYLFFMGGWGWGRGEGWGGTLLLKKKGFFPFRVNTFSEGRRKQFDIVATPESVSIFFLNIINAVRNKKKKCWISNHKFSST